MPWKQFKKSTRLPTRQDILIITGSLIIGLIAIAFFALRS
ncbi:putative membrane protein [Desulfosporosinus sp. OT]|nr:putative membrane protein [Desulfosporosinus sp. OT]